MKASTISILAILISIWAVDITGIFTSEDAAVQLQGVQEQVEEAYTKGQQERVDIADCLMSDPLCDWNDQNQITTEETP